MKIEFNITKRVAAIAAAVTLLPLGIFSGGQVIKHMELRAEAEAYAKVCDAAAPDVITEFEYSIDAQRRYVDLLKLLVEGRGGPFAIASPAFILTSEAANMANRDAEDAFFTGGEESFYNLCDKARFLIDEDGKPQWDDKIAHLHDASLGALKAIELFDVNYDLREQIKELEDQLRAQYLGAS